MNKSIDKIHLATIVITLLTVAASLVLPACGPGSLVRPLFSSSARTHHTIDLTGAPQEPLNLSTTPFSVSEIELNWDDESNNETGFVIERADEGSTEFTAVFTTESNETSFIDSGLAGETGYFYRVCAIGKDEVKSEYTATVSGMTMLLPPTSLTARSTSPTEVELTWVDASTMETSYVISRKLATDDDSAYNDIATLEANAGYYLDPGDLPDGLLPVTEYNYRIRAHVDNNLFSPYTPFDPVTTQGANYLRIVPLNGLTLQETLEKSQPGDTILVMPDSVNEGPYKVNLVCEKKSITLKSFGGPGVTTLDGGKEGSVLSFSDSPNVMVEGFTITNGKAEHGGGIICSDSEITLRNNIIENNIARREGGGVYLVASTALVEQNRIRYNEIQGTLLAKGGGIACNTASAIIKNNTVIGNEIGGYYSHGAGISLHGGEEPQVINNVIRANSFSFGLFAFGGGIDINGTLAEIANNHISFNEAGGGGGISITGVSPLIVNNLICRNTVTGNGGGIQCNDASPEITNNTIAYNHANGRGGGMSSIFTTSKPVVTNCIIWGNMANVSDPDVHGGKTGFITFSNLVTPGTGGQSCIYTNPEFVDPSMDNYHLLPTSPCIDKGSETLETTSYDLDGESRVIAQASPTAIVDMGMDEHHTYNTAAGEYHVPVSYNTITEALNQANVTKITVAPDCAHGGPYLETLDYQGKAVNIVSQMGAAMTTIDGGETGSVVIFENGEGSGAILDGFTITNGLTSLQGGGIQITGGSSPTIRNNIIIDNHADLAGGGISCDDNSSPAIDSNQLSGNTAGQGGGFYCKASTPTFLHNQLLGNTADLGGGALLDEASITLFNNLFVSNVSDNEGGGLYLTASDPSLGNCTFFGNLATIEGGGLFAASPSAVTIIDSIFSNNQIKPGGTDPEISDPDELAAISYSCIALDGQVWPGTGNINDDPSFWSRSSKLNDVAEDREFLLRQSYGGTAQEYALSPCVDAGSDTALNLGLNSRTTTTENNVDDGMVDLGYHYTILP